MKKQQYSAGKEPACSTLLQGIGVSAGIVVGRVVVIKRQTCRAGWYQLPPEFIQEEVARFQQAVTTAEQELRQLRENLADDLADSLSIIDSHILMLKDRMIYDQTVEIIRLKNVNAEWALAQALTKVKQRFDTIADPYIKERYADVKHVADRVFGILFGREPYQLVTGQEPVVVVANDFSPEDTMQLHTENILGLLAERGGMTSHTSIVARSLNIPAVIGLTHITGSIATGDLVIIDGDAGTVIVAPSPEQIKAYRRQALELNAGAGELAQYIPLSATTFDGYQVQLSANVEMTEELASVLRFGSQGIGLFRSEFDFFHQSCHPDEAALYTTYRQLLETLAPHPVTVRTLDVGGDKFLDHLPGHLSQLDPERNPALGLRSIRFSLYESELFSMQLRALLRASVHGRLRILFPLVSSLAELHAVKAILRTIIGQLEEDGLDYEPQVELGVMVEVPSAVILADVFAKEVDFLAVGTNDLIQYSLAIDRSNQHVAHMYDPFHPAVLRMIKQTIDAGHAQGIPVSVCGEMAGDILCATVLFGLGVDELSMRPAVIPYIKRLLRHLRYDELQLLGQEILHCVDGRQVQNQLMAFLRQYYPEKVPQL
ncbi:phosphoenolpyruvate--protein phosphotransferase [Desulfogranum mediterraneum]|uniref:phosphoenolpyruvate--protein phosphotransferase n=1 Tax=Desulfogranum mediterraneum TaxID=160661 RepID=UPI0003FE0D2E|nr:phosphoenolpyruvate--protein phosphotransferase [Desulfogranum mediterraneum]